MIYPPQLQKQIDDVREREQRNAWLIPLTLLGLSTLIQLWMKNEK